jgi:hypothetical protein
MLSCKFANKHTNRFLPGNWRPNQASFFVSSVFLCTTVATQGTLGSVGVVGTKVAYRGAAISGSKVVVASSKAASILYFGSIMGSLFILK